MIAAFQALLLVYFKTQSGQPLAASVDPWTGIWTAGVVLLMQTSTSPLLMSSSVLKSLSAS